MRRTSIFPHASDCDWFGRSQIESVGDLVWLGYPCFHGIHTKKTRNSCAGPCGAYRDRAARTLSRCSILEGNQPALDGIADQIGLRAQAQLAHQIGAVALNCAGTEI
jgi:hypothetical protein